MPKKNKSTKQMNSDKIKKANATINRDIKKNNKILNELESEANTLQNEINSLNTQISSNNSIFSFFNKSKNSNINNTISKRERELQTINDDIKNIKKELKPYMKKKPKAKTLKNSSNSKTSSNSKSKTSSSSNTTKRVRFKRNSTKLFDKKSPPSSISFKSNQQS